MLCSLKSLYYPKKGCCDAFNASEQEVYTKKEMVLRLLSNPVVQGLLLLKLSSRIVLADFGLWLPADLERKHTVEESRVE